MDGARSIGIGKHELSGFVAPHDEALSDMLRTPEPGET